MLYLNKSTAKELSNRGLDLPIILIGGCVGNVVMVSDLKKDSFTMSSRMEHQYVSLQGNEESSINSISSFMEKLKSSINSSHPSDIDCREYSRDGKWSYTISDAVKRWEKDNT